MKLLFNICASVSIGVIFGMLVSIIKRNFKKNYTEKQIAMGHKFWKIGSKFLTILTSILLVVGLIWCVFFLILGMVEPGQAEYANNMSELIVSVLTVVSIFFAFYEFIRRK